jgi:predicted S18 family serine protease
MNNVIRISDFDKKRYNGQYKRVFNALNRDECGDLPMFTEGIYELDEQGETRDQDGGYYIYLSEEIPEIAYERLSKIKGVKIVNN